MLIGAVAFGQNGNKDVFRIVAFKNKNATITSVSNTIESNQKLHIHVPSAFSPDGDGINDAFFAVSEGVEDFNMQVYNRWGEVVFESNDIEEQWDGSFKGELSQEDAYVYVIEARGMDDDEPTTLKGTVSLIK